MGEGKGYIRNTDEKGSISISEEVIAVIAGVAAIDVDGVYGLFISHGKELTNMIGRKGLAKGIKLQTDEGGVSIDVSVMVEMGYSVSQVGEDIQRGVASAVESAVGVTVSAVNVNICGVSLKKKK